MFQIEIPKRSATCAQAGEPLTAGMEYFSALVAGEHEGSYERRDYCPACWEGLQKQKKLQEAQSTWKSVVPSKKEASELPKQRDDRALYLLKEVLGSEDPNTRDEAFVLALYLARRRRIYLRQELKRADAKRVSIYEVADTEEMLCVPKIDLSALQVETIQTGLAKKFNQK